jgi:hypothetical protein
MVWERIEGAQCGDECVLLVIRQFRDTGGNAIRPSGPMKAHAFGAGGRDRDANSATVIRVGLAHCEAGGLEPIDEGRHSGLREAFARREFGDPKRSESLESAQRAEGARRQTGRFAVFAEPGEGTLERVPDCQLVRVRRLHASII